MRDRDVWTRNIFVWGIACAACGLVLTLLGLILPNILGRFSLATGLVLLGLGIVSLLQFLYLRRNPKAGGQMMIQERDERMQMIRARAGNRAYGISSALAFFALIWVAFAGDVGLPVFSSKAAWFSLVAVVVIPYMVYAGSIVYEQSNR